MLRIMLAFALFFPALAHAQDDIQFSFYKQQLTDGKNALRSQNYEKASRYLEIARFGLIMDREANYEALKEIAVLRVLVQHELGNDKEKLEDLLTISARFFGEQANKPSGVNAAYWDKFLEVSGRKPPPLPEDASQLEGMIRSEPQNAAAYAALIRAHAAAGERRKTEEAIGKAMDRFPGNASVLKEAVKAGSLVNSNKTEDFANALLRVENDASLAHEALGNIAFRRRDYDKATEHYSNVGQTVLAQTAGYRQQTGQIIAQRRAEVENRRAEAARREAERASARETPAVSGSDSASTREQETVNPVQNRSSGERREAPQNSRVETPEPPNEKPEARIEPNTRGEVTLPDPDGPSPAVLAQRERERKRALKNQIDQLEAQARSQPQNLPMQYRLASLYIENDQMRKAGRLLKKLAQSDSESDAYKSFFAHYNFARGTHKINIDTLAKLSELPDQARYYLGKSYFASGQFEEARAVLSTLNRDDFPDLSEVDKGIARAADRQ